MPSRHDPTDRRSRHYNFQARPWAPGTTSLVAAWRNRRDGYGAENTLQGKIEAIYDADDPMGDCEEPKGCCCQRFHPSRRRLRSFPSLLSHTNRKWSSIGNRSTVADRGRMGGGSHTRSQGVNYNGTGKDKST